MPVVQGQWYQLTPESPPVQASAEDAEAGAAQQERQYAAGTQPFSPTYPTYETPDEFTPDPEAEAARRERQQQVAGTASFPTYQTPLEEQLPMQPFGPAPEGRSPVPAGAVALPGGGYAFGRGTVPTEAERWQDEQRARLAAQAQSRQQPQGFTSQPAGGDTQLRKLSPEGGYDYASIRGDQQGMLGDFRRRGYETYQAPTYPVYSTPLEDQLPASAAGTQPFGPAPGTPEYLKKALGSDVLSGGEVRRRKQIPDILAGVSPENPFGRFMSAQGWNRMTIPEQEMFQGELANRGISGSWAREYERQRRAAAQVGGGRRQRIPFAARY